MTLMLINQERLDARLAASVHRVSAWSDDGFRASRDKDYGELMVHGTNAIIPVTGPLSYKYDFWSWLMDSCSYVGLANKLKMAEASDDISQIVMIFDTPGGEVTGCRMTAEMVGNCKKPVVGYVDPEAASAGLWLASQCSRLVCMRDGWIGSLGVQTMKVSYADMLKEQGYDVKVIRSKISPNKNLGHPAEPMSDEAVADAQERVDMWGEEFLSAVAAGRGKDRKYALDNFGKGKMLYAQEALDVGLIDAIGTMDDVLLKPVAGGRRGRMTSGRVVW